ncbi:MAG: AI-2E family transporter [Ktedonobacteraceae bacterium]
MERVNWQRTRDILISIICIGIILWYAWGLLLGLFVHAVVLLLLSLAVAFLLTPAVNFLQSRGLPRVVAALSMYVIVIAVLGALAYALVFSLIQQVLAFQATITNFFTALPVQYTTFLNFLRNQGIPQSSITAALDQIQSQATDFARSAATNVLNMAFIVTNTLIDVLLILVLSFYFTLDGKQVRNGLISITPKSWMPHVLLFEDALNRVVGNYIRGQLTLAVIIGVLAGVGCTFLGLSPYALIIGVMAFLFETIPMVGPALASIPALLLSLLLPSPFPRTIWILIYFIAVQMIESNILGPRIVGHAVGLHPVASIMALIVGAQLFGAFGALLATPIVAAAWVVIASLYRSARGETADQIMANKRTGWVIRRRKPLAAGEDNEFLPPGGKQDTSPGIQADDEARVHEPDTRAQPESNPTHTKGSSMHIEHIDLLRPVPDTKEPQTSPGDEEQ